jgi:hypothetical protein
MATENVKVGSESAFGRILPILQKCLRNGSTTLISIQFPDRVHTDGLIVYCRSILRALNVLLYSVTIINVRRTVSFYLCFNGEPLSFTCSPVQGLIAGLWSSLSGMGRFISRYKKSLANQCCGSESGSTGSTCFWAFWIRIRIHQSEVWIRIWILLSPSKKSKKNLYRYSYCFATSFCLFLKMMYMYLQNVSESFSQICSNFVV